MDPGLKAACGPTDLIPVGSGRSLRIIRFHPCDPWLNCLGLGLARSDEEAGHEMVGDFLGGEGAVLCSQRLLPGRVEGAAIVAVVLRRRRLVQQPRVERGAAIGE